MIDIPDEVVETICDVAVSHLGLPELPSDLLSFAIKEQVKLILKTEGYIVKEEKRFANERVLKRLAKRLRK